MSVTLVDQQARDRFKLEWDRNFAVRANAGSGKTTAISARLAAMARSPDAAALLAKTAVVTFTKKAAAQIGQRARSVLLEEMMAQESAQMDALDHLDRAFFGTIHSFCLLLARRYGQQLGIHLNPTVVTENDDSIWEEFIEQDSMQFESLEPPQLAAYLRHVPLEHVFELARELDAEHARELISSTPDGLPAEPSQRLLQQILTYPAKGSGRKNVELTQRAAREWCDCFGRKDEFLPPFVPAGHTAAVVDLCREWMKPLKHWLAQAAATMAGELALRYRAFRLERGIQTYADQVEAAVAVLRDPETLRRIREEGWRIILDEAQDTDAQQFAVLVEITRPTDAALGTWPARHGVGPRPGHFCMVGDAQQAIYGARADIRNFLRHLDAFARGDGGELLTFHVTFRAPKKVITLLNDGFPPAFSAAREHNVGLPVADGAPAPFLQVQYEPLAPGPGNLEGNTYLLELRIPERIPRSVEGWLEEEVRQLGEFLVANGPASVGAAQWGEVCILAPRNEWLATARRALEKVGLKVALQVRRQRQGDGLAYAWIVGLLSVLCDPDNSFEWFGVLREVFGVTDSLLALELREKGSFRWDDPSEHAQPLRDALERLRPWILSVDDGGAPLGRFVEQLVSDCECSRKLDALDATGAQDQELVRILALAAELGEDGAGPRELLRELLKRIDDGRAVGKPEPDAINLLTAHSAKGLEWPVVIPIGLWRKVGKPPESGLRLLRQPGGDLLVFFDSSSVPDDTQLARDRERLRELVRLLYVTLTRVRRHLVIPWQAGFGGRQHSGVSFADLWGSMHLFEPLPRLGPPALASTCEEPANRSAIRRRSRETTRGAALPALPARLLPHELSAKPDLIRSVRHEATVPDRHVPISEDDAIEYGLWWHETVEYLPWTADEAAIAAYFDTAVIKAAASGFAQRAEQEVLTLRRSSAFAVLREERWTRLAELSVLAPFSSVAWIDGVMDLVLHDEQARQVWVVDWKTNRRRAVETPAELLARLRTEYASQLEAYGRCVSTLFPDHAIRLLVYGTAAGDWTEIPAQFPLYSPNPG